MELPHSPDSPYPSVDPTAFKTKLSALEKTYGQKVIQEAVKSVFEKGRVQIVAMEGKNARHLPVLHEWLSQERTIADILVEIGNEHLLAEVKAKKEQSSPEVRTYNIFTRWRERRSVAHVAKMLTVLIQSHMQRNPAVLKFNDQDNKEVTLVQEFTRSKDIEEKSLGKALVTGDKVAGGTVEVASYMEINRGYPSAGDSKGAVPNTTTPTNLASIFAINANGEKEVVVSRSGRPDSKERLFESVAAVAYDHYRAQGESAFQTKDGKLHFQHAITSFMDFSKAKAAATHSERAALLKILDAVDEWPPGGLEVTIDGHNVILEKPIFEVQPFSGTVRGFLGGLFSLGQRAADRVNFAPAQRQFYQYLEQNHLLYDFLQGHEGDIEGLAAEIEKRTGVNIRTTVQFGTKEYTTLDFSKVSQKRLFASPGFSQSSANLKYQQAVARHLANKYYSTDTRVKKSDASDLYRVLFRQEIPERPISWAKFRPFPSVGKGVHAEEVENSRNNLRRTLKTGNQKTCKSGVDRTGKAVASAVGAFVANAKSATEEVITRRNESKFKENASLFNKEALKKFVIGMTTQSKHYFGMMWGQGTGNPVVLKSLSSEKSLFSTQPSDDKLYSGKLSKTGRLALLGGSVKAIQAKVKKFVKEIPPEQAKSVNQELAYLGLGADLLNAKLQFDVFKEEATTILDTLALEDSLKALQDAVKTKMTDIQKRGTELEQLREQSFEHDLLIDTAAYVKIRNEIEEKEKAFKEAFYSFYGFASLLQTVENRKHAKEALKTAELIKVQPNGGQRGSRA